VASTTAYDPTWGSGSLLLKVADEAGKKITLEGQERDEQKNDYNLNLTRYIPSIDVEDIKDVEGHLRGGIPARDISIMAAYWAVMPSLREALLYSKEDFAGEEPAGEKLSERPGYVHLRLLIEAVKAAILEYEKFAAFDAM
jgi:type I restriction enzyme M protein